jgi:hypothetical protein
MRTYSTALGVFLLAATTVAQRSGVIPVELRVVRARLRSVASLLDERSAAELDDDRHQTRRFGLARRPSCPAMWCWAATAA